MCLSLSLFLRSTKLLKNVGLRICCAALLSPAYAQTNSHIDATRPTVSSDAAIQQKGVLQIEAGYDGYFSPYDGTQAMNLYYAATNWLRIDGAVPGWRSTDAGVQNRTDGLGNSSLGAKLVLFHQGKSKLIPGVAVQYSATFPSATEDMLRSRYHRGTLILSQTFANWGVKVNGSLIGDCYHSSGCGLRGQGVAGVTYNLSDCITLAADVFGDTVSVSAPPGIYQLSGVTYKLTRAVSLNTGVRFGLNSSASTIGITAGITVGFGGAPHTPSS